MRLAGLAAALGLVVTLAVASAWMPAPAARPPSPNAPQCGKERWLVKTLADKRRRWVRLHHVRPTSVRKLIRKQPPSPTGDDTPRRRGVETTVYRLRARLVEMKLEDDSDIHLVIRRTHGKATMIVEFPHRACIAHRARARRAMIRARAAIVRSFGPPTRDWKPLHGSAIITGVGFFDEIHGQTGVAPNGIELHPVLRFIR
jgi:hypothetical protein